MTEKIIAKGKCNQITIGEVERACSRDGSLAVRIDNANEMTIVRELNEYEAS